MPIGHIPCSTIDIDRALDRSTETVKLSKVWIVSAAPCLYTTTASLMEAAVKENDGKGKYIGGLASAAGGFDWSLHENDRQV